MKPMTSGRVVGMLAVAAAATLLCVSARAQASAPLPLAASAPVLPAPPHQLRPDAPLYPDYYALAMTHAQVTDDPAWRPLHLELAAGRQDPVIIVLPVQTQAYGFSTVWRALVGARLDQELERRHLDASRQTDIVDWRGPFVRRTDDTTIAALSAEHPRADLLALYVGHDGLFHAFVSLARTEGGKTRIAHRRVELSQDARDTPDRLSAVLPAMLAELGLGDAKPAPALPARASAGCDQANWTLDDLSAGASPVATACHAVLIGSLLPDYMATLWKIAPPDTPDRLAWLARAWVEASALAPTNPAMSSVATLAAFQLGLDPAPEDASSLANDADPVVRPLARMFWARPRASQAPGVSRNETTDRYVATAVAGLPDFAAAAVREHADFNQEFRAVDLCPMQVALPHFAVPAGCEEAASAAPRPTRPASRGQRQLLDAWRVAAAWNGLYVEGHMRGSADRLARFEQAIPARVSTHPLVREMRFAVRDTPPPPEDIDSHLARTREEVADYLQAVATLQRSNLLVREYPIYKHLLLAERQDPAINRSDDAFRRLQSVEFHETVGPMTWHPDRPGAQLAAFLADGPFGIAEMNAATARGMGGKAVPSAAPDPKMVPKPTFAGIPGEPLRPRAELEQALAADPFDFFARLELAMVMLEHGEGVAAARRLLDARRQRGRLEDDITESDERAQVGDLFFFAGELDAAGDYYQRASSLDTGSASDIRAKLRVAAIAGDLRASLAQAHQGSVRYRDEWLRSDEAGYDFMLGQPAEAWSLLLPRMQTGTSVGLWRSALVGHRMAATPLADLPDWITRNRLVLASADGTSYAAAGWLRTYATLDRLPTSADVALLKSYELDGKRWAPMSGALVIKSAIEGSQQQDLDALARDMQGVWGSDRALLMPFYGWALWNASGGKDARLDEFRALPLEGGFARALAKAMVLAADGRRDEALRFLTAARYELSRNGAETFANDWRTASYDFVLATWLMTRKTGERAYARQGLAVARGYQRVTEYLGWPYAAEALLGDDPKARAIAACRAQWLDPGSMMLRESGLHPDQKSAACRKAITWR